MGKSGIVIHCSASTFGNPVLIDDWHAKRGFGASYTGRPDTYHCGYHAIITNGRLDGMCKYNEYWDGKVMAGRPEKLGGAHARGVNRAHLGVCLIGKTVFTGKQLEALHGLVSMWISKYGFGIDKVIGHTETMHQRTKNKTKRKSCPNIPMGELRKYIARPSSEKKDVMFLLEAIKSHNLLR